LNKEQKEGVLSIILNQELLLQQSGKSVESNWSMKEGNLIEDDKNHQRLNGKRLIS
jgi:hypothetical protein